MDRKFEGGQKLRWARAFQAPDQSWGRGGAANLFQGRSKFAGGVGAANLSGRFSKFGVGRRGELIFSGT